MSYNPLAPVTDYASMRNRIFWFTTASASAITWMLRGQIPAVEAALAGVDAAVANFLGRSLPMPGGTLAPALTVGVAARIFRLHNAASSLLGIRDYFDVEVILGEFLDRLGLERPAAGDERLHDARHPLMRRLFYAHVSAAQPTIDRVLVEQALDAWSWLWIGVEAALLWSAASLALVACGDSLGYRVFAATVGTGAVVLPSLHGQCRRYGAAQVRAILADPDRAAAARQALWEATTSPASVAAAPRRAA